MLPLPFHSMSRRPFLNVSTGESIHVRIPDLYGRHYILGSTAEGFLVLCRRDTLAVQLLNPLTGKRAAADLPRVTTLLNVKAPPPRSRLNDLRVGGVGLAGGDSTVALHYCGGYVIAVARPGDKCWTRLRVSGGVKSAMSFAGRFYCVTYDRNILVVEAAGNRQPPRLAVAVDFGPGNGFAYNGELQLLDNGGELILVHVVCHPDGESFSGKYTAYRVRLGTRSIEPMHGLGGRALFMGASRSLSMNARVSRSVRADTVYKCSNYDKVSGRAKSVVAIDLLGRCIRIKFRREDVAYCLSSYVCA
ncbi:unnamed protein product [Urochloa decumbens]|uniref:KIB1-4 beta-propeller domain-containing protein n=1 Tax=Urochloa decumbens TaxID=240449 RepID=A0ABC9G3P8_9POAL